MAKIRTPKVFGASGSLAARMTGGKSVSGPANGGTAGTIGRAVAGDPTAQVELADEALQRANDTVGRMWNIAATGATHGLNAAWSQEPNKAMLMSGNNLGQSDVLGEWRHKASPPKLPFYKEREKKEQGGQQEEGGEGPNTAFGHPSPYDEDEITRRKTDWKLGTPDRRSDPRKSGSRTGKPGSGAATTPAVDPADLSPTTSGPLTGTTRPSGAATGTTRPSGGTGNTSVPATPSAGRQSGAPTGTTRPSGGATGTTRRSGELSDPSPDPVVAPRLSGAPTGTTRPSGGATGTTRRSGSTQTGPAPATTPSGPAPGRRSGQSTTRSPAEPRPSGTLSGTSRRSGELPGNVPDNPFSVGNLNRRRSGAVVESTSPGRPSGPPTGTTRPSGAPTRNRLRSGSPKPYETPVKRGRKKPGLGTS